MHGAAVQLSYNTPELSPQKLEAEQYDALMVTDMLDLATLRGLRPDLAKLHTILFFHENQITYPWSPEDEDLKRQRDQRYGWINYTSALAADELWFNSAYHQRAWNEELPSFLYKFPEGKELPLPRGSQSVLPIPIERIEILAKAPRPQRKGAPIILWNHRWEYDKGPDEFFETCRQLKRDDIAFQLIVLGESYARVPKVFAEAEKEFASEILHWGFAPDRKSYEAWLVQADILLVTSKHDFFGISAVEAIAAGAIPVLPEGLAYREHIPENEIASLFYTDLKDCYTKTKEIITHLAEATENIQQTLRQHILKYDSQKCVRQYDRAWLRKPNS